VHLNKKMLLGNRAKKILSQTSNSDSLKKRKEKNKIVILSYSQSFRHTFSTISSMAQALPTDQNELENQLEQGVTTVASVQTMRDRHEDGIQFFCTKILCYINLIL